MNKRDLANILTEKLELPKSKANRAVNLVFESISEQLSRGRQVTISGFGVFEREKGQLTANTRKNGGSMPRPAFKASRLLGRPDGDDS